jgi:hypothetical protein
MVNDLAPTHSNLKKPFGAMLRAAVIASHVASANCQNHDKSFPAPRTSPEREHIG